jgi:hypothetical protein
MTDFVSEDFAEVSSRVQALDSTFPLVSLADSLNHRLMDGQAFGWRRPMFNRVVLRIPCFRALAR